MSRPKKKRLLFPGFPTKKYHIIYADPPWSYTDKKKSGRTACGAENHYPCMTLPLLRRLPVKNISEPNSVLFLWATFPLLKESLDVIDSWGFTYKTIGFDWTKLNKNGSVWHGVGAYTKSNNEICLFATKGKVGRLIKCNDGNVIITDPKDKLSVVSNHVSCNIQQVRKRHSEKPSIVREKIVELFGDISRIELFARVKVDGWDVWGNEI